MGEFYNLEEGSYSNLTPKHFVDVFKSLQVVNK